MAVVTYAPAIQTVSGALTKINKKSAHAADQKMILATHRKAESTNRNCLRLYIRGLESVSRTSAPSQEELLNRTRFGAVSRAAQARLHDLSKMTADQAAYKAQTTYKSLYSYVWHLEADAYDNAQG